MFILLTTQPPYILKQVTFNLLFPYNVYSIVFHFGDCFKQLQCTLLNISENCIVDVHKRTTSFWWNKQDQNIQIESCGIMNNASELIVGKIIENGNVRVAFLIRKAFVNGRMLKRLLWLCCRNLQYNFIIFSKKVQLQVYDSFVVLFVYFFVFTLDLKESNWHVFVLQIVSCLTPYKKTEIYYPRVSVGFYNLHILVRILS